MTPTIRIRYLEDDEAEFVYRGNRHLIVRTLSDSLVALRTPVIHTNHCLAFPLTALEIRAAIREVVTMFD